MKLRMLGLCAAVAVGGCTPETSQSPEVEVDAEVAVRAAYAAWVGCEDALGKGLQEVLADRIGPATVAYAAVADACEPDAPALADGRRLYGSDAATDDRWRKTLSACRAAVTEVREMAVVTRELLLGSMDREIARRAEQFDAAETGESTCQSPLIVLAIPLGFDPSSPTPSGKVFHSSRGDG